MGTRSIKGLRCDLNLSQQQMADKLNISVSTFKRYEHYKNIMPVDIALNICSMCNITIDELKYK